MMLEGVNGASPAEEVSQFSYGVLSAIQLSIGCAFELENLAFLFQVRSFVVCDVI